MKRSFMLLCLFFAGVTLSAQTPLAPVYELKADKVGTYTITKKHLQFLNDSAGIFSLDQVQKMGFKYAKDLGHPDERVKNQWFRYRIKNPFNHPILLYFNANSDWDELYYLTAAGKWQHKITGLNVPWAKKTDFKRFDSYYVNINPNEEYVFYQRSKVNPVSGGGIPRLIFEIRRNIASSVVNDYELGLYYMQLEGFILGFTLLAAVFSFLFFCFTREKVYLYFSFCNITFILGAAVNMIRNLFFTKEPGDFKILIGYGFTFFFYFLWLFLSDFYKTKQYFAKWTKITGILSYWPFVFSLVALFSNPYFINPAIHDIFKTVFPFAPILFSLNIVAIVIASILKNRAEFYFNTLLIAPFFASALFLVISLILFSNANGQNESLRAILDKTSIAFIFSYCWVIIMFLLKLVFRHQKLQRELLSEALEKEKLAKESEIEKSKLIAAQKTELEQQVAERTLELNRSLQRSDALLLNILPEDVAEELKEKGTADAHLFDEVTVLFTDFVNFTNISEQLSPQELVDELHQCFKAFDEICAKYNIEKIKTIGDAYLAVAGLPTADPHHALHTVKAAKEITAFIHNRRAESNNKTFDIRVGINSGSVVAGIVGVKKFAYDIWGDTVNIAARMEQNSEPGKINVSEKTYELIKDDFELTYRGEIEAKNKGALKMYFVGDPNR